MKINHKLLRLAILMEHFIS